MVNFIHYKSSEPNPKDVCISSWDLFQGSEAFTQLKVLVEGKMGLDKNDFEVKWKKVVTDFQKQIAEWGGETSLLNIKLYFLKRICNALAQYQLYKDKQVCDIVLNDVGLKAVGERNPVGLIVGREISDEFGVLFTIEKDDGQRIAHEFFD